MGQHQNELIARLRPRARASLLALAEHVPLGASQVVCEAGDRMDHVYFPIEGSISLVAVVGDSPGVEVGMVGAEGMLGAAIALGVPIHPARALVQGPGGAWRIPAAHFTAELERSGALRQVVSRYLYVLICQQASTAVCLRFHKVGPRVARWLLMTHDRAHRDSFRLTQEFLATMMGVRRVGITQAAGLLQRQGLIAYRRGDIRVLDRVGLEEAACACYGAQRAIYRQIFS